jgi:hypothetical protein
MAVAGTSACLIDVVKVTLFQRAVVLPGHGSQRVSESEKPGVQVAVRHFASAQATSADWLKRVGRLLYTHNPFYLLSVAFVLHSTRLWLNTRTWPYDPWPLMDIIGGYIVLVAIVGFLVIRLGKAWDDARSIFLILLLLFVELSLTFDPVLVAQPRLGLVLLLVGWLLAVAVSEGLLWGLRIRMPPLFRRPYHLLLALLFLYPPLIVAGFHTETVSAIWRIWAFSPIASLALLTLLPAIRRGPDYVRDNGTPWSWPSFPWGLFGFLGLCLGTRAYALTLSFDSVLTQGLPEAMRLQSAFSPFFLVPLVLASGVLLLEAGLVARNRRAQRMALIVPVLAWLSACSLPNPSVPAADFLERFTEHLGAPLWSATWAGLMFFLYARLRGVKDASGAIAALLLLGAIGPRTVDWTSLRWQAWPLWILALLLAVEGIRHRRARELALAGATAIFAARFDFLRDVHWIYRDALPLQFLAIWAVILGVLFDDAWGRGLRWMGLGGLVAGCLLAILWRSELPAGLPWWSRACYLGSVVAGTIICAYIVRSRSYFFAGIGMLIVSSGRLLQVFAFELQRAAHWDGAGFFVLGIVWLILAVLISSAKSGLAKYFVVLVPRPPSQETGRASRSGDI